MSFFIILIIILVVVSLLYFYFNNLNSRSVNLSNYTDAFDRVRVSEPQTLFSSHFQNGEIESLRWSEFGSGTGIYVPSESCINITCNASERLVRQSNLYVPYQPGKSSLGILTGVLTNKFANSCISKIGIFDDATDKTSPSLKDRGGDGHFFQLVGDKLSVVQRKTITVSPYQSDFIVNQEFWNLDKLDGKGDSNFTLNPLKSNIFVIEREWLGVGRVRMGIFFDGSPIWCHQFINGNTKDTTYMKRASLPVRYELNNASSSDNCVMKQICSTISSEGGFSSTGRVNSFSNPIPGKSVSTSFVPLISIRLNSEYSRGIILPTEISAINTATSTMQIVLLLNPVLTGASFTPIVDSFADVDTSATSLTGGTTLATQTAINQNQAKTSIDLSINGNENPQTFVLSDYDNNSDILTLAAVLSAGPSNVYGSLTWIELN